MIHLIPGGPGEENRSNGSKVRQMRGTRSETSQRLITANIRQVLVLQCVSGRYGDGDL